MTRLLRALWLAVSLVVASAPLGEAQAAYKIGDIACESSADTGTGAIDLDGAYGNYQSFITAGIANGDTFPYHLRTGTGLAAKFETGIATFTDGTPDSIARSVEESSDGAATALNLTETSIICIGFTSAHFTGDKGDISVSANNVWTVDADSVALTTDTTGVYVAQVADGTGVDGSCNAEGCTYTPTFDATELSALTWSAGGSASFTWTIDLSGVDPSVTFGSGTIAFGLGNTAGTYSVTNTSAAGFGPTFVTYHNSASPAANDRIASWNFNGNNSTPVEFNYASVEAYILDPNASSEDGLLRFGIRTGGSDVIMRFEGNAFSPQTSDTVALGTSSLMWSDAFWASGAVLNWNAGDCLLTHSSNSLALTGSCVLTSDSTLDLSGVTTATLSASGANLLIEGTVVKKIGTRVPIPLLAGAGTIPSGGAIAGCSPVSAFDSGTNDVFMRQCSFAAGTDNAIYFTFFFPKGAAESIDLVAQVGWTSATGTDTTDDVIWTASAVCFSDDDAINGNAFPAVDTVTDTQTAAGDYLLSGEITAITPAGTPAEGDACVIRFTRDADAGGDNFNGTAEAVDFRLYYNEEAANDN